MQTLYPLNPQPGVRRTDGRRGQIGTQAGRPSMANLIAHPLSPGRTDADRRTDGLTVECSRRLARAADAVLVGYLHSSPDLLMMIIALVPLINCPLYMISNQLITPVDNPL